MIKQYRVIKDSEELRDCNIKVGDIVDYEGHVAKSPFDIYAMFNGCLTGFAYDELEEVQ